ncbi:MAG TPA: ABC transporter ATP-binding protein, partial [Cytophagales bacterium]|nr:ABC transporter ATP-binding protein [Cytophagales bacterium]
MLNSIRGSRKVRQNRNKVGRSEQMQSLRNIPRLLRLIWATHPRYALANILLRLLQAALPFTMLYMGKLIVDEVVLQLSLPAGERTLTQIWIWISVEIAMALASDVLNRLSALVDSLLGDLFANASSVRMLEHAARLDLEFFEDPEFYNILERARGTSFGHTQLMSQVLGQIQSIITMLLFAGGLVVFNPWLILLVVVAVVPAFLGDNYFNERNYSMLYNYAPERRELEYLRHVGTNNEAAKEVKIFGLSRFLIGRFAFLSDKFYQDNKHLSQQMAFWGTVFALVGNLGYYGAYAFIVVGTVQGDITLGELTFLSGSVQQLRTRVSSILSGFSQLVNSALFLQDFFDFFAIEPKIKTTIDEPRPFPEVLTEGFVFEGVGFQYPNTDRWVLRKLSFRLGPGEKLALVGENGAGKTTLVKLLTRLYDPTEGRILLEGHDLREYDPEALRSHIGVIFQDFMRYQMTAGTNIAVGSIEARETRE